MGELELGVFRRLDNRLQGDHEDKSPLAWELHKRRAVALHGIFDQDNQFRVVGGWAETDDTQRTHELVTLAVVAIAVTVVPVAVTAAGVIWLGRKLRNKWLKPNEVSSIQALIEKLRPAQRQKLIGDFFLNHPNFQLSVNMPDQEQGRISLSMWHDYDDVAPPSRK